MSLSSGLLNWVTQCDFLKPLTLSISFSVLCSLTKCLSSEFPLVSNINDINIYYSFYYLFQRVLCFLKQTIKVTHNILYFGYLEKQHSCFYKSNLATILLDFPVTIKMEILLKSPEHHTCEEYLAGCFARFAKFLMQAAIVLFWIEVE